MSTHDMLDRPARPARARPARAQPSAPRYMSGFGNSFETEALPGALPIGRNSPQRVNYGLYAEQLPARPSRRRRRAISGLGSTASAQRCGTPAAFAASTRD